MKVLVDTSVWSLALRRKRAANSMPQEERQLLASLTDVIRDGRVAMIGPIRQEVLSGIKDPAQFNKLSAALESFPDDFIGTQTYIEAARMFNLCRTHGVQCGPINILICAAADQGGWKVLTNDRGLMACIEVLRGSGLFSKKRMDTH